jgi:hypothetical protein
MSIKSTSYGENPQNLAMDPQMIAPHYITKKLTFRHVATVNSIVATSRFHHVGNLPRRDFATWVICHVTN